MKFRALATFLRLGPQRAAQMLFHLPDFIRLFWRLFKDPRVPLRPKLILLLVLGYIFLPVDFLPDALIALGQIDDLAVLLLGLQAFVRLCPAEIVREHVRAVAAGR